MNQWIKYLFLSLFLQKCVFQIQISFVFEGVVMTSTKKLVVRGDALC